MAVQEVADKLAKTLLYKGVVEKDLIVRALKIRNHEDPAKRRSLAQILVKDCEIDHDKIFVEVKNLYGFREITYNGEPLNGNRVQFIKKMFEIIPDALQKQLRENSILPFRYDENRPEKLIIIAADPTDRLGPFLARTLGVKRYEVCYMRKSALDNLFQQIFPQENEFLKELKNDEVEFEVGEIEDEASVDEEAIENEINKSMLTNLVEGMLVEAVRKGASDIHMVPIDSKNTEISMRVDGKLRRWGSQEGIRPEALAAVVKDRSKNVDRFEREMAQDGFIQRKIDGHMIRFRVSVIPIVAKQFQFKMESIVIRILDDRKVITDLDKLGFHGNAKKFFIKSIEKPQGMIIVTGPTGSGKSTTLIAALSYIINPEINVLTVEDPVEYIIKGARQLKISHKMTFELALRAILRHDPDVVMVGEIRDKETAEMGIKLANTGHLTFSTLHTNDAPSAVSRLFKMGVETFLIAYAINIIIAQRLIRRLCENCKEEIKDLDPAIPKALGFTDEEIASTTFYKAVGCNKCHGGYKGRAAIHEALYFTPDIRTLIFKSGSEIDEEKLKVQMEKEGMMTLRGAG
ncbi:MAG TPA: type II/IV secretion system protein, partial [Caldithrix sp.]|nr:type II/IV secretion system protein [Caldithrix sp.]